MANQAVYTLGQVNKCIAICCSQERAAQDLREGGLQTYKQQMSFGVHVILMMAAFYAVGHTAGGAISTHPAYVCLYLPLPQFCIFFVHSRNYMGSF